MGQEGGGERTHLGQNRANFQLMQLRAQCRRGWAARGTAQVQCGPRLPHPHQALELSGVGGSLPDQGELGVGGGTDLKGKPMSWAEEPELALPTSPAASPRGISGAPGAGLSIGRPMTPQGSSWLMSPPASSAAILMLMGCAFCVPRVGVC